MPSEAEHSKSQVKLNTLSPKVFRRRGPQMGYLLVGSAYIHGHSVSSPELALCQLQRFQKPKPSFREARDNVISPGTHRGWILQCPSLPEAQRVPVKIPSKE